MMRYAAWIGLGLLFVGYLVFAARGMRPGAGDFNLMAISACEGQVSNQLTAPASAKFSGWGGSTTKAGPNGSAIVHLYVDAQNSYGATVRTYYTCTVAADRSVTAAPDY